MRIALAYPYDGHAPNDVIDVDDRTGRRLISDGRARLLPDLDPQVDSKPAADTGDGRIDLVDDAADLDGDPPVDVDEDRTEPSAQPNTEPGDGRQLKGVSRG